jgi:hypothetical protein
MASDSPAAGISLQDLGIVLAGATRVARQLVTNPAALRTVIGPGLRMLVTDPTIVWRRLTEAGRSDSDANAAWIQEAREDQAYMDWISRHERQRASPSSNAPTSEIDE